MRRLSKPLEAIQPRYDVVVVGSGYGGAIAASRLARTGRSVCLLERGPERQPGEFPDTPIEAQHEMQVHAAHLDTGPRTGLFDFHVDDDIVVLTGCGLGGTSLINANVSLRPDPRVFDDPAWPAALRADAPTLERCSVRAERMLGANPYPHDWPSLAKYTALQRSGAALELPVRKLNINVTFKDGENAAGVKQNACTLCGDCVTGCNHGAKNTTLMNYLPDAVANGAELFTCAAVSHVERAKEGGWLVFFEPVGVGRERFHAPELFVAAGVVVLGAGALGSTGILLRSRERGLAMSPRVGTRFSGNGDVIGFAYNADQDVFGIGMGPRPVEPGHEVGPCITGVIDGRDTADVNDGFIIEEGDVPGVISAFNPAMYAIAGPFIGEATEHHRAAKRAASTLASLVGGAYHGATQRTQTFLVMSHDGAGGTITLENGRPRVRWPGIGKQPHFQRMDDQLHDASAGVGAVYFRDPLWTSLFGNRLITVHPLGGVPMGERGVSGATNHKGQVFLGEGEDVWPDLYVMDGSVLPRSVGVNPLLTISAIAERNVALLAADRGWAIDYDARPRHVEPHEMSPSLEFTETMRGFWLRGDTDDFIVAERAGKTADCVLSFTLTVRADDARAFLDTPEHEARMFGTVVAPALSPDPLTVSGGVFNLFVEDEDDIHERRMKYAVPMRSPGGHAWYLEGFKRVRRRGILHAWADTSTLYVTIHDGADASGRVIGRGVLHIEPADFQRQLTTLRVAGAKSAIDRLAITSDFGRLFAGVLYETYGGIAGQTSPFADRHEPRKRRPLRVGAPDVHVVEADDGTELRLTRYQGGAKGPVILAPGFGTTAAAYALDTVDTNFVEYLCEREHDVWLFDYRASPALPSASRPFTIDDVARRDWPAAVHAVRELSGAPDVQVVAHCVGSLSFLMAQLHGLTGVRSAVCSALTAHPRAPLITELKAELRLPSILNAVGVERLTASAHEPRWYDRVLDEVMRAYPTKERCHSPVCRKILFMYGEVYDHEQLNRATHEAIHEVFGVAHMTPFAHLAEMVRLGHIVDAEGRDSYMPHVERLAIPVTFIHGDRNNMFLPAGSEATYNWLCEHNGDALYRRLLITGYAHMDCFIGKEASRDVFPTIVGELERQSELRPIGLAGVR